METQYGLDKLNDTVYLAYKGHGRGRGAQIVFIHGLQFEENKYQFLETWLSEDRTELWPKAWLSEAFAAADIYLVRYDSCIWKDDKSGRLDMFATAESLLQDLLLANIGQSPKYPVILIGQDVGGLVIKEICIQAFSEGSSNVDRKKRLFLQQVKGIFYFSTPHQGLHYWDQKYQGELMKNLRVHNAAASRTNAAFSKMRTQYKWRAYGLGASFLGEVDVKEASARYDVDQFRMIPATAMNICRLKDRMSSSFQWLEDFIRDTISGFTNPDTVKLPFTPDPRYVPLESTVHEIRQRLEDPDIQVVVLYGDTGTGKSSLTKYLALQLEEESTFSDGIFYFPCGRGKEAATVLRNMLRELHVHENRIPSNDEDEMHRLLREQLQNLNALVIFDDVWDDERISLVEKVVVPGARKVKYLLSSQQSQGWRLSGYSTCKIEDISFFIAQQIIIKRVGLRNNEIPEDDAETVNEIITMTDFHPLALATISGSVEVDSEGRVRGADWEDLRESLLFYLAEEDSAGYATSFGETYPKSVFAAMMYAVDLLSKKKDESLYLMCIMALFESPLPTSVLHMVILCTRPKAYRHVYRLINRLRDRLLVQHACALSRVYVLPPSICRTPYAGQMTLPYLKMHGLRQQFILTCAEYDSSFPKLVEVIKETLAPFLSGTNFGGGAQEVEQRKENPSPVVLITALFALYGIPEVQNAARSRLCNYQLKISVRKDYYGHVPSKASLELLMGPAEIDEHSISTPVPNASPEVALSSKLVDGKVLDLDHPRTCLEVLMAGIEVHSTSTNVHSALQKVVWNYMFHLEVDDANLSILISRGYDSALSFLMHHLTANCQRLEVLEHCIDKVLSSVQRSLAAATSLLRIGTQSNMGNLMVLSLLQQLAVWMHMTSVHLNVFDLEVLIDMFHRVHESRLDLSSLLIQIFGSLVGVEKIGFRLIFLLQRRPGMQEAINSFIETLVADLNTNKDLELLENSTSQYSREVEKFLVYTIYQVGTVLKAVRLLCDLWPGTFGDENVVDTVKSMSKLLQALVRLFPQNLGELHCIYLLVAFRSIVRTRDQIGRSVLWSIPGATQGIVSVVSRPMIQQQPYAVEFGLSLLAAWTSAFVDDGIRSYLLSEGFLDMLVEVIGDYKGEYISGTPWVSAVQSAVKIIEQVVTSDDTAASVCASLPKLHQVLHDLLLRHTGMCTCTQRSVLTILLQLGYRISVNDQMDSSGCCMLQALNPIHSQIAVVGSWHALKVQNAFESLFEIIDDNGQKVAAQVATLQLLGYLLRKHSRAKGHIYAMPGTATTLSLLLHGDDADVQKLALDAILELADGSGSDSANQFMRQIVLTPGTLERLVEFMGYDLGGRGCATVFLYRYLELHPESASRMLTVRDSILSVIVSLQNKDQSVRQVVNTLFFLLKFSQASSESVSFFVSIKGSVEAVVELLAHNTHKLGAQPGPALELRLPQRLPHRTAKIREHQRTDLLLSIARCLDFLILLAAKSEEAVSRMVATGRVFDPVIDLLDNKQGVLIQEVRSSADPCHEKQKWRAIEFLFFLASRRRNAVPEKIIKLVYSALQDYVDLLTASIDGGQVPTVVNSLRSLVEWSVESRAFVMRAPGAFESLVSLSVHHEQLTTRADALHILRLSLPTVFQDNACMITPCLLRVLDVLPAIVDQLPPCLVEQQDSLSLQCSVIQFLILLAVIAQMLKHDEREIKHLLGTKLTSVILYTPPVLEKLVRLLQRDEPEVNIHKGVMHVLSLVSNSTVKGMFRIVQIPGALERVVELVCRGNSHAFLFVRRLITTGKLRASAPRYLLKCLIHVISKNMGKSIASEVLQLLALCALENKTALHYLIDMLHQSVRCSLRTEAMSYLIAHVSENPQFTSLLASLRSFAYDPSRHDYLEPGYDFQVEVLCILVWLVERSSHSQWRIAQYVTGVSVLDLSV